MYTYKALKHAGIKAEYETTRYELMPSFRYGDENITRAITWTPDFVGDGFIIECKGFANETFPIKLKLFKWKMINDVLHKPLDVYVVRNQKQVDAAIQTITYKLQRDDNIVC